MRADYLKPGRNHSFTQPPSLETLHAYVVAQACSTFHRDGEVLPTFYCCGGIHLTSFITAWADDDEKHRAIAAMRRLLLVTDRFVQAYSSVSEAWAAVYDKDVDLDKEAMPRDRKDRREIIMVTTFFRDGQHKSSVIEIKRGKHWKVELGEPDDMGGDFHGGHLWNLFAPARR